MRTSTASLINPASGRGRDTAAHVVQPSLSSLGTAGTGISYSQPASNPNPSILASRMETNLGCSGALSSHDTNCAFNV